MLHLLIRGVCLFDPEKNVTEVCDLRFEGNRLTEKGEKLSVRPGEKVLEAKGLCAAPGFVDLHCHLREPGFSHKETIRTGCEAAAAGGFTTVLSMPNVVPPPDNEERVSAMNEMSRGSAAEVLVIAAATKECKGKELCKYEKLKKAGAVAVSDDGLPVSDDALMEQAVKAAADAGLFVASHCEVLSLSAGGVMNAGRMAEMLGLPGIPAAAEEQMIAREIDIARRTGRHVHICHVSTKNGADMLRRAKQEGVPVTAETCPHYLSLTEDEIPKMGTYAKVNPPLRTETDRQGLIAALLDGTIDAVATDHAPHTEEEKAQGMDKAPSGFSGFETAFAILNTVLVCSGTMDLASLLRLMNEGPARAAGLDRGRIYLGGRTDLVLFDPLEAWTIKPEEFRSMGKNTPYKGRRLYGRVHHTVCNGRLTTLGKPVDEEEEKHVD